MNEQEFAELSEASALGALDAEQQQAFDLALTMHPEWRGIAERDLETAAALADYGRAVRDELDRRIEAMSDDYLRTVTRVVPWGDVPRL